MKQGDDMKHWKHAYMKEMRRHFPWMAMLTIHGYLKRSDWDLSDALEAASADLG